MKNIIALVFSATLVAAIGLGFSSCKDDDPPAKPKLSFAETEITVNEDDGNLEVEIVLDKAFSKDLRIEYDLGGTASDQDLVGTASADYEVVGDHGVVEIPAGETSGIIELEIYSDAGFEEDETIAIAITDTNTDEIELTADDETEITITNDDEQITASFTTTTVAANEADGVEGLLLIAVQLDKTPAQDVTVKYTLAGTAIDSLKGYEEQTFSDYYINGVKGDLVIPSGQSSGNIEIQLYTDYAFEDDETIEITLNESNDVKVGTNSKATITLDQEDGKVIALVWDPAHTDVDLDLFLWIGPTIDDFEGVILSSLTEATTPRQELIFIPTVVSNSFDDAAFGLSYVYYSGTAEPMNFEVHFIDFIDGEFEADADIDTYAASYMLANLNEWDNETEGSDPAIVQTFRIVDGVYQDFTDITVPATGSRIKTFKVPAGLRKNQWKPSRSL